MARIVHLTTVHNLQDPRIFWKELPALRDSGYETHLIAQHDADETRRGIRIHALPRVTGRYRRLPLLWQAYRRARAVEAAVYHFHDPELIPVGWALKRATGAKVMYDMHEDYWWKGAIEGPLLRALEQWCFRWVDHVVLAERSYDELLPPHLSRTCVENYALEFEGSGRTRSVPANLLYTGVVADDRGLNTMLRLVDEFARTGGEWQLNIVGVCNLKDDRRRAEDVLTQNPRLAERVKLVGWDRYVSKRSMQPYYRTADVGLALMQPHSNFVRSMPTKFYEYLQAGLPILCSEFPLWRQFVEENQCGAVVAAGDVEAAARILTRWRSDPAEYRQLAQNARKAAPKYRWKVMGERLVRVYDELVAGSGEGG